MLSFYFLLFLPISVHLSTFNEKNWGNSKAERLMKFKIHQDSEGGFPRRLIRDALGLMSLGLKSFA